MTDMELAEEIERHPVTLRLPHTCKPNSLEVDIDGRALTYEENQQIIAALRREPEPLHDKPLLRAHCEFERPPSSEMLFHVDGKEMKLCDCSAREGKCPRGVERRLLTTEFSRCLLPR